MRGRETDPGTARGSDRLSDVLGDAVADALHGAADGAFVSDVEGSILLWNAAAEAILGYSAADVVGRPCCTLLRGEELTPKASATSACAIGRDTAAGKATPTFDMRTRTKAGVAVWINVSVLTVADPRTRATFIVHLFRGVTSGKKQVAPSPNGAGAVLTRREGEVLRLMGEGLNTAAMAKGLHLSRATVRNHVQNILLKLDVHSRLEAVAYGRRHRLL